MIPGLDRLSYSKVKCFLQSPKELSRYIHRDRQQSDAMIKGSLLDCLLFEPEKFNEYFYLMPEIQAKTKTGEIAKNAMQTSEGKAIFQSHILEANERMIVRQYDIDQANLEKNAIQYSKTVQGLDLLNGKYQEYVNGELSGWSVSGKIDILRENGIADLKRVKTADPLIIRKDLRYNLYNVQAYIYQSLTGLLNTPYHLIVVDDELNVEVFNILRNDIENGKLLFEKAVNALNREIKTCKWLSELRGEDISDNYWKSFYNKTFGYWAENSDGTFDL